MKVRDLMNSPVRTVNFDSTILEAAVKMKSFDVGCLPVLRNGKIAGMITDRDIVIRVVSARLDPAKTQVNKAMSSDPICCSDDTELSEAARMMEDRQIHRLVVVNGNNEVSGMLSVGDLASKTGDEHLLHEVLERVCEPAGIR